MTYSKRGGRYSQKKGKQFESFIEKILVYLKNQGRAEIYKKDTPITWITKKIYYKIVNGRKVQVINADLIFKKKSTVDFEGFLNNGQHVCFECKYVNIENEKYLFNIEHELQYLYRAWTQGCLAFLLVYTGNFFYKFFPDEYWFKKKSITLHFKDGIKIGYDRIYDFLEID